MWQKHPYEPFFLSQKLAVAIQKIRRWKSKIQIWYGKTSLMCSRNNSINLKCHWFDLYRPRKWQNVAKTPIWAVFFLSQKVAVAIQKSSRWKSKFQIWYEKTSQMCSRNNSINLKHRWFDLYRPRKSQNMTKNTHTSRFPCFAVFFLSQKVAVEIQKK